MEKFEIKKAVILAGGLGTRFLPATLVLAKELFPIGDKPALMYHLENLQKAGIKEVLIVGNKLKEESFKSFLTPSEEYITKVKNDNKLSFLESYYNVMNGFDSVSYINQEVGSNLFNEKNGGDEFRRGSSIAILACKEWANGEAFMVINGDDLCAYPDKNAPNIEARLISLFNKTGDYIIVGKKMNRELIYKYSSMVLKEELEQENCYKMADIIEKPAKGTEPSDVIGCARYIYTSDVFDRILTSSPRANGEFCITDLISDVAKEGKVSTCIFDGLYFDCGSMVGLQMAGAYLLLSDDSTKNLYLEEFEKLKNILK